MLLVFVRPKRGGPAVERWPVLVELGQQRLHSGGVEFSIRACRGVGAVGALGPQSVQREVGPTWDASWAFKCAVRADGRRVLQDKKKKV